LSIGGATLPIETTLPIPRWARDMLGGRRGHAFAAGEPPTTPEGKMPEAIR
jgi:hypothetical protein